MGFFEDIITQASTGGTPAAQPTAPAADPVDDDALSGDPIETEDSAVTDEELNALLSDGPDADPGSTGVPAAAPAPPSSPGIWQMSDAFKRYETNRQRPQPQQGGSGQGSPAQGGPGQGSPVHGNPGLGQVVDQGIAMRRARQRASSPVMANMPDAILDEVAAGHNPLGTNQQLPASPYQGTITPAYDQNAALGRLSEEDIKHPGTWLTGMVERAASQPGAVGALAKGALTVATVGSNVFNLHSALDREDYATRSEAYKQQGIAGTASEVIGGGIKTLAELGLTQGAAGALGLGSGGHFALSTGLAQVAPVAEGQESVPVALGTTALSGAAGSLFGKAMQAGQIAAMKSIPASASPITQRLGIGLGEALATAPIGAAQSAGEAAIQGRTPTAQELATGAVGVGAFGFLHGARNPFEGIPLNEVAAPEEQPSASGIAAPEGTQSYQAADLGGGQTVYYRPFAKTEPSVPSDIVPKSNRLSEDNLRDSPYQEAEFQDVGALRNRKTGARGPVPPVTEPLSAREAAIKNRAPQQGPFAMPASDVASAQASGQADGSAPTGEEAARLTTGSVQNGAQPLGLPKATNETYGIRQLPNIKPASKDVDLAHLTPGSQTVLRALDGELGAIGEQGRITSGKRAGVPGIRSLHNSGQAVDFTTTDRDPASMQSLAQHLRDLGFSANYETAGQINANGSVATGNHIHVSLNKMPLGKPSANTAPTSFVGTPDGQLIPVLTDGPGAVEQAIQRGIASPSTATPDGTAPGDVLQESAAIQSTSAANAAEALALDNTSTAELGSIEQDLAAMHGEQERAAVPQHETPQGEAPQHEEQTSEELAPGAVVERAALDAATHPNNDLTEPTEAQQSAGNYPMGHLGFEGLDITISHPRGSERSGVDENGDDWTSELKDHYGYIRRTTGADGEQIDAFIGANPASEKVFVVDQVHPVQQDDFDASGEQPPAIFDEHKVILGTDSLGEAYKTYTRNYPSGATFGAITQVTVPEFKDWLKSGDTDRPFRDYINERDQLPLDFGGANATSEGVIQPTSAEAGGNEPLVGPRTEVVTQAPPSQEGGTNPTEGDSRAPSAGQDTSLGEGAPEAGPLGADSSVGTTEAGPVVRDDIAPGHEPNEEPIFESPSDFAPGELVRDERDGHTYQIAKTADKDGNGILTKVATGEQIERPWDDQPHYTLVQSKQNVVGAYKPKRGRPGAGQLNMGLDPAQIAEAMQWMKSAGKGQLDLFVKDVLAPGKMRMDDIKNGIVNTVNPKQGVPVVALDIVHKAIGRQNMTWAFNQKLLQAMDAHTSTMGRADLIDFVDRMKSGQKQKTPELQAVADQMRVLDDDAYRLRKEFDPNAAYLENHFRVPWKSGPNGAPLKRGFWSALSKRPMQGSRGFMYRHVFDLFSQGLALGYEPISYNPVRMFTMAYMDQMKYAIYRDMMQGLTQAGYRKFVPDGAGAPDGFSAADQSMSLYEPRNDTSWPTDERGQPKKGEWAYEDNAKRILKNYTSVDLIRQAALGKTILDLKNLITPIELSVSAFHFTTQIMATFGHEVGRGIRQIINPGQGNLAHPISAITGAAKGLGIVAASPISTGLNLVRGAIIKDAIEGHTPVPDILKRPPAYDAGIKNNALNTVANMIGRAGDKAGYKALDALDHLRKMGLGVLKKNYGAQAINDAINAYFLGGGTLNVDPRLQAGMESSLDKAIEDSSIVKAAALYPFALIKASMAPLFEHFVPMMKLGMAFEHYRDLSERNARLPENEQRSRGDIARETVRRVEDLLGEMNFDNLHWNHVFKSILQMTYRSVSWFIVGTQRVIGRAAFGQAKWSKADARNNADFIFSRGKKGRLQFPRIHPDLAEVLGQVLSAGIVGALISRGFSKKWPWEWGSNNTQEELSNFLDPHTTQDGKGRMMIPGYPNAWSHMTKNYPEAVSGSLSGLWTKTLEDIRNRNWHGDQVYDPSANYARQLGDAFLNLVPVPFTIGSLQKNFQENREENAGLRGPLAFLGFKRPPATVMRTPMQQVMDEYARENARIGGRDKVDQMKLEHEQQLRALVRQGASDQILELQRNALNKTTREQAISNPNSGYERAFLSPKDVVKIVGQGELANEGGWEDYRFNQLPPSKAREALRAAVDSGHEEEFSHYKDLYAKKIANSDMEDSDKERYLAEFHLERPDVTPRTEKSRLTKEAEMEAMGARSYYEFEQAKKAERTSRLPMFRPGRAPRLSPGGIMRPPN